MDLKTSQSISKPILNSIAQDLFYPSHIDIFETQWPCHKCALVEALTVELVGRACNSTGSCHDTRHGLTCTNPKQPVQPCIGVQMWDFQIFGVHAKPHSGACPCSLYTSADTVSDSWDGCMCDWIGTIHCRMICRNTVIHLYQDWFSKF